MDQILGKESQAQRAPLLAALACLTILSCWILLAILGDRRWGEGLNKLLSSLLSQPANFYLSRRHAAYSARDSSKRLPGCSYVWPNGQGDVAKFLFGKENSEIWRRAYGSIYRIWSGSNPEIVVSRPEDIQTVFKDSHQHSKAPANNAGRLMHEILGQCLGLINDKDWRGVRAVVDTPFRASNTASHLPVILEEIRAHLASQVADETSNLALGKLDPVADLKFVPFWIVARILYGDLNAATRKRLEGLIPLRERLWGHMLQGGVVRFNWGQWLPWLAANRDLGEWKRRWKSFNRSIDSEASAEYSQNVNGPGIPPIMRMYSAVRRGDLTEEQLLQTLDEMLFANLDVTMGGVSWNFVFLAAHPDIQAELRNELRAACADTNLPSIFNSTDEEIIRSAVHDQDYLLSTTTLLHASMLEASRLRPLAAFSVPQSAPTARVLGAQAESKGSKIESDPGYLVPPGTSFIVDTHTLNLRDKFWGDSEMERIAYNPRRWLQQLRQGYRYRYWRFGFGPRQCLGRYVADAMIKSIMVAILQEFEVTLPAGEGEASWARDSETWIMHPKILLKCSKLDGLS